MHHVHAIALYLALFKLDRLVDSIPQDMPLYRQEDPHSDIGIALYQSFTLCRGWGVCMHTCLSKCFLLWKMQYTLSEDFFFNFPLNAINSLTVNKITLYQYAYI